MLFGGDGYSVTPCWRGGQPRGAVGEHSVSGGPALPPCSGMLSGQPLLKAPALRALSFCDQPLLGTPPPRPRLGMLLEASPGCLLLRAGTKAPCVILSVLGGCCLSCAALAPGSGDTHSLPTLWGMQWVPWALRGCHARRAVCRITADYGAHVPCTAEPPVPT